MPNVIFTITTNAAVTVLSYLEPDGDKIRIEPDQNGVRQKDFPAGSDQTAVLWVHGLQGQTADLTIEQQTATGKVHLAERRDIYVPREGEIEVKVDFRVREEGCG